MNVRGSINENAVSDKKKDFKREDKKTEKKLLITDETSVYAIDMECFKEKEKN